jgi:uncharacterized protein (TIGR03435 family)
MSRRPAWVFAFVLAALASQTETKAPLAFEVASVKLSRRQGVFAGIHPEPGGQRYTANKVPLSLMIQLMYRLKESQLEGGPDWVHEDLYDIDAKAELPSNTEQLHEMFKTLLADRFQLRMHTVKKELPAYALVVDKSGSKLKASDNSADPFAVPILPAGNGRIAGKRVSMPHFSWYLSLQVDRPVVDQTGLDGFYDFTLVTPPRPVGGVMLMKPDEPATQPTLDDPPIFSALREQLGLKLESRKAPVDVYVIDHVERPTEN